MTIDRESALRAVGDASGGKHVIVMTPQHRDVPPTMDSVLRVVRDGLLLDHVHRIRRAVGAERIDFHSGSIRFLTSGRDALRGLAADLVVLTHDAGTDADLRILQRTGVEVVRATTD